MRIDAILFGVRLRNARLSKGYTQNDVANILGCTQGLISQYEAGNAEPDISRLIDFSVLYNLSLDFLLKGDQP